MLASKVVSQRGCFLGFSEVSSRVDERQNGIFALMKEQGTTNTSAGAQGPTGTTVGTAAIREKFLGYADPGFESFSSQNICNTGQNK